MDLKIKCCGLFREQDILAANRLRPDYIGFVFFKKSPRAVTEEQAAKLKALLDPGIRAAGVFVDEDPEIIAGLLNRGVIDLAQLHGSETEADILALRKQTEKPVIKAFVVGTGQDLEAVEDSTADYVLIDSGRGSGKTLDRSLLKRLTVMKRPWFLAGGLDPQNIEEALEIFRSGQASDSFLYGVDVSSGIETDHLKDPAKMERFIKTVRRFRE